MRFAHVPLLILLALQTQGVSAGNRMPCDPEGQCSDPCAYFPRRTVFVRTEDDRAKLKFKGHVYELNLINSKNIRKHQAGAEVPGDIDNLEYSGGSITVTLTQKVLDTSCYYKNEQGIYESASACCSTKYELLLKISSPTGSENQRTTWDNGC